LVNQSVSDTFTGRIFKNWLATAFSKVHVMNSSVGYESSDDSGCLFSWVWITDAANLSACNQVKQSSIDHFSGYGNYGRSPSFSGVLRMMKKVEIRKM
jgi:hypothetical protein